MAKKAARARPRARSKRKRPVPVHNVVRPLIGLLQPLSKFKPDPKNSVRHSKKQVDAIAHSLTEWGQDQPLVIQKQGWIIRKGNGRYEAAKQLGWTHVAAIVIDEKNVDAVLRAVADNKTSELREWDEETLRELLAGASTNGKSLSSLGFSEVELQALLAGSGIFPVGEVDCPILKDGDRQPFQQMTFTLSDKQAGVVKRAIDLSKHVGPFVATGNENSNGNALARIAEAYRGTG